MSMLTSLSVDEILLSRYIKGSWGSDLSDRIKGDFFKAVVMLVQL